MASVSGQPSPQKQDLGRFDNKGESPTLPPQRPEQTHSGLPLPIHTKNLDAMEEEQNPAIRPQGNRGQLVKTPEPSKERTNGQKDMERSPSTPGHLAPFDWDEFEARYEEALTKANGDEQKLLDEFEELIKYFNVWAAAASVHDTERGIKRLQTRERYVKIAEQNLSQKKKHRKFHGFHHARQATS
jgi:hypothetical protein